MTEQQATIKNYQGIHCRPSAVILKSIEGYNGEVRISSEFSPSDKLSMLGLMSLGLEVGQVVTVQVEGPDEEQVCGELVNLFETIFDFPPEQDPETP